MFLFYSQYYSHENLGAGAAALACAGHDAEGMKTIGLEASDVVVHAQRRQHRQLIVEQVIANYLTCSRDEKLLV